jgi:hypothetical protein
VPSARRRPLGRRRLVTSTPSTSEVSGTRPSADRWQARILTPTGEIRGSGVLISDRHVLTCAHVLADGPQQPREQFLIDFPRSRSQARVPARVPDEGWFPELPNGRQDVAVLELDEPLSDDVVPARLSPAHGSYGRGGLVYGHPNGAPDGFWSRISIADTTGPYGERVQISGQLGNPGDFIARGFSGGGVIDETSAAVIGVIVTTIADFRGIAAWMIPMEIIAGYVRHVLAVMPEHPGEKLLGRSDLDRIADVLGRLRHLGSPSGRQQIAERLPAGPRSRLPQPPPTIQDLVHACRQPSEVRVLVDLVRYFDDSAMWDNRLEKQLELLGAASPDALPAEPEELTAASGLDLRNALIQVPYFRDVRTRRIYLDAFQRRLHSERNVTVILRRSLDAEADAEALIEVCRRYPGSLRDLPKDFPSGDQDRPESQALVAMIDFLTDGQLLVERERAELIELVRGLPGATVKSAHRRAVPWTAGADGAAPATSEIIRHVEQQAQRPGDLPRIIVFAEELALRAESASAPLRAWTDRVAARQHLPRENVTALRQQLIEASVEAAAPVLTIHLAPDALRPRDRFLFSAVLDHGGRQRVVVSFDEPESVESARAHIDDLLDKVYEALDSDAGQLTVEVVVPRTLLTEAVDQWETTEAIPVPLGEKFPVVLRSYERMRQRRLWPQWSHKWRLAQQQSATGAYAAHYVGPDEQASARDVYEALSSDDKLALVLGRPPADQADLTIHDAYAGALQAGAAYVVWVREVALAEDFRAAVDAALADIPVRELPARIAEWRSPRGHAGLSRHISVVACDYDRRNPFAGRELGPPKRRPS